MADTSSSTMRVLRGRRYPAGGKTLFTGERLSPARGKHQREDSLKNATRFSNQKAKNHSGASFYQMPRIFLSNSRAEKSFLTEFKHSNTKTDKKLILWLSQRWLRPAEVSQVTGRHPLARGLGFARPVPSPSLCSTTDTGRMLFSRNDFKFERGSQHVTRHFDETKKTQVRNGTRSKPSAERRLGHAVAQTDAQAGAARAPSLPRHSGNLAETAGGLPQG